MLIRPIRGHTGVRSADRRQIQVAHAAANGLRCRGPARTGTNKGDLNGFDLNASMLVCMRGYGHSRNTVAIQVMMLDIWGRVFARLLTCASLCCTAENPGWPDGTAK